MALGPQLPESTHRGERRLLDRAVFLGDLGRTAKSSETNTKEAGNRDPFKMFLEKEVDEDEEVAGKKREEDTPEVDSETASATSQEVKDDQIENRKDAARQALEGGAEQAERATASNHGLWRGPQLNMGAAMVSVPQQLQAQQLEKQGRTQKQRDAGDSEKLDEVNQRVDDALLQALRQSGLAHPVTGFADPRLKNGPPQLGPEWSVKAKGANTVYRWEASASQRQVLRWSEKESLLETTAAGQRQVIQKMGEQYWSETTAWDGDGGFELTPA
ncbi:hypothetical protein ABS71_01435 [bacterium SCN 62-11]|nr:hypothetical protein [Candidatus Eremiobacteraeota bacterium]ODT78979.1 MAG: hypothetical protein ABS71_01435 [bacterium SCN 62-11]